MEKFMVETSARHIHLTQEVVEKLFGAGFQLTVRKELSQPGQFASGEKVTVVGPKGEFKMSILGPCRDHNQVEVSLTDARTLGIAAPVRESGDVKGTPGCKVIGPCGEVDLEEGVIAAKRHIHMNPAEAERLGCKNGDVVEVRIDTDGRSTTFGDTVVRVNPNYVLAMHIDTDEANACGAKGNVDGYIVK